MLENKEITLKSGNTLTFQHADFLTKSRLLKEFTREASKRDIDLDSIINIKDFFDTLIKMVIDLSWSDAIDDLFWECSKLCLWNGVKIQRSLFDLEAEKILPDYLELKYYIIKENLSVFFSSHLSGSSKPILQENQIPKIFKSLVSK